MKAPQGYEYVVDAPFEGHARFDVLTEVDAWRVDLNFVSLRKADEVAPTVSPKKEVVRNTVLPKLDSAGDNAE